MSGSGCLILAPDLTVKCRPSASERTELRAAADPLTGRGINHEAGLGVNGEAIGPYIGIVEKDVLCVPQFLQHILLWPLRCRSMEDRE